MVQKESIKEATVSFLLLAALRLHSSESLSHTGKDVIETRVNTSDFKLIKSQH